MIKIIEIIKEEAIKIDNTMKIIEIMIKGMIIEGTKIIIEMIDIIKMTMNI